MNDDTALALCIGLVAGVLLGSTIGQSPEPLTTTEKRNIVIDFMAEHGSWRYTICNMPMDSKK